MTPIDDLSNRFIFDFRHRSAKTGKLHKSTDGLNPSG